MNLVFDKMKFSIVLVLLFIVKSTHCSQYIVEPGVDAPLIRFLSEPLSKVEFANTKGTTIECLATGDPSPSVQWTLIDGSPASNIADIREATKSGNLVFSSFRAEDFRPDVHLAVYRCVASNGAGVIHSRNVRVRGVVLQNLDIQVYDAYAIEGNTAVLKCYIPTVQTDYVQITSWIKNDNLLIQPALEDTEDKYAIMPSGELHIRNVSMEESGSRYKCKTVHRLTGDTKISSTAGKLFVTKSQGAVPPRIISQGSTSIIIFEGQTVALPCATQGNPIPTTQWLRKSQTGESSSMSGSQFIQSKSALIIRQVSSLESGIYICEVGNEVGNEQHEYNVTVIGKVSALIKPPIKSVKVGDQVSFKCEVNEQNDGTSISWLHNGSPIERVYGDALTINNLQMADGGFYQCFVKNIVGDSAQAIAEIRLSQIAPQLVETFEEISVQPGNSVTISCKAQGIPMPSISWDLDGVAVKIGADSSIEKNVRMVSTLKLDKLIVEDGGLYSCTASNENGKSVYSARINVFGSLGARNSVEKMAVSGGNVILNCPVYGYPIHQITWEKDGQAIPFILRQLHFKNDTLGIVKVNRLADSGDYKCVASNDAGQRAASQVKVKVIVPPKIVPFEFQEELLREGMRARLQCVVSEGDLPLSVTWLKDGKPMPPSLGVEVRVLDEFSSILTISSITPGHNGKYTCIASNQAATVTHTSELSVNVPPKIVPFSFQDDHLVDGTLARVSCVVSRGDLPIRLEWEKDGKKIESGDVTIQIKSFDDYSSILSISDVNSNHNGHYTCVANNEAGSVRHSAQLVVHVPPRWVFKPQNVATMKGNSVMLNCQADGYPKPDIVWMQAKDTRYDTVKSRLHNIGGLQIFPNGSLLIEDISSTSEGFYFCQASNGIGSELSAVVQVKINTPPFFQQSSSKVEGALNGEVQLQCLARGDTPINIVWYKNNKVIQEAQSRHKIETTNTASDALSVMTIKGLEKKDSGTYVCNADNKHGSNKTSIDLIVKGFPDAPTGVTIASLNSRSVELSWDSPADGNDNIKKYIIQFKRAEESWDSGITMETVNGQPTNSIVSQLSPSVDYLFRLYAENSLGRSPASQILRVTTHEDVPSHPPVNVNVEAVNTETFKVMWKAPEEKFWNGKVLGFYVGYKEVDTPDPYLSKTLLTPNPRVTDLTIQISGLKQFTKYAVVVQAYNGQGKGPQSAPVVVMTSEGAPSLAPTDVHCTTLTSQSIHVTWTAPPLDSINGILRGYKVLYRPASDWFEDLAESYNLTISTSLTLNNLEKFSNYSVEVLATTKAGSGPKSYSVFCKTQDDVPGAPVDIKAIATADDSVIVAWKPPESLNGVLRTYNIYWRNPTSGKKDMHTAPANENSYEVIGLRKGQLYEFWVAATTVVGEGLPSRTASQTPAGPTVAAKMVSFDEKIISPWKSDISLLCQAVGLPEPMRTWFWNGKPIEKNDKYFITSNGALSINNVEELDAGDYSCHVQNDLGKDKVTYSIIVLAPPSAPLLQVTSISSNAIDVYWKTPASKTSRIKGYTLHVRRDIAGEWREITVGADVRNYLLNTLDCGTRYEVIVSAFNKIGMGSPSETIMVSTNGSVPTPPNKSDIIEEKSTSVSLYLNTWKSNGCPIHYYVVEYAPRSTNEWTFVSNTVKPEQSPFVIPGLKPSSRYELRMTAHNSAGSSVAQYNFATLTVTGATISADIQSDSVNESVDSMIAYLNFYVIVPICCTIIILAAILAAACFYLKMRTRPNNNGIEIVDNRMSTMSSQLKRGDSTGSFSYLQRGTLSKNAAHSKYVDDDLTPYATCQLVNHPGMMSTMGRRMNGPPLPPPRNDGFMHSGNQVPMNPHFFAHAGGFVPLQNTTETTFIFPSLPTDDVLMHNFDSFAHGCHEDTKNIGHN